MSSLSTGVARSNQYLSLLGLCLLLLIAGCAALPFGGPSEQERPVTVVLNNSVDETHTFTVWVVSGEVHPDSITIYKKNGEVDHASPGEGLSTYQIGGDYGYVTSVEPPPNRSRLHGQYTLSPKETEQLLIENFTIGSSIVISFSERGRVIELTIANCAGRPLVGLELAVRTTPPGDLIASYGCG